MKKSLLKGAVALVCAVSMMFAFSIGSLAAVSNEYRVTYTYRHNILLYTMVGKQKDVSVNWDLGTLGGGYLRMGRTENGKGSTVNCSARTGGDIIYTRATPPRKVIANLTVQYNSTGNKIYNYVATADNQFVVENNYFGQGLSSTLACYSAHEVRYTTAKVEYARMAY